jgi:hypothetical protein
VRRPLFIENSSSGIVPHEVDVIEKVLLLDIDIAETVPLPIRRFIATKKAPQMPRESRVGMRQQCQEYHRLPEPKESLDRSPLESLAKRDQSGVDNGQCALRVEWTRTNPDYPSKDFWHFVVVSLIFWELVEQVVAIHVGNGRYLKKIHRSVFEEERNITAIMSDSFPSIR